MVWLGGKSDGKDCVEVEEIISHGAEMSHGDGGGGDENDDEFRILMIWIDFLG